MKVGTFHRPRPFHRSVVPFHHRLEYGQAPCFGIDWKAADEGAERGHCPHSRGARQSHEDVVSRRACSVDSGGQWTVVVGLEARVGGSVLPTAILLGQPAKLIAPTNIGNINRCLPWPAHHQPPLHAAAACCHNICSLLCWQAISGAIFLSFSTRLHLLCSIPPPPMWCAAPPPCMQQCGDTCHPHQLLAAGEGAHCHDRRRTTGSANAPRVVELPPDLRSAAATNAALAVAATASTSQHQPAAPHNQRLAQPATTSSGSNQSNYQQPPL